MKKLLASFTVFLVAVLSSVMPMSLIGNALAYSECVAIGDIDADGDIDSTDVYYVLYYCARVGAGIDVETIDDYYYDVNRDGKIDSQDTYEMLYYCACVGAGLEAKWPLAPELRFDGDQCIYIGETEWNVRLQPDLSTEPVLLLNKEEQFTIVRILAGSWYEIEYGGISSLYIQIPKDAESKFLLTPPELRTTEPVTTEVTTTTTEPTTSETTEGTTTAKLTTSETTEVTTTAEPTTSETTEVTTTTAEPTTSETTEVTTTTAEPTTSETTEVTTTTAEPTTSETTEVTTTAEPITSETTEVTTTSVGPGCAVCLNKAITVTEDGTTTSIDKGTLVTIVNSNQTSVTIFYRGKMYTCDAISYSITETAQAKEVTSIDEVSSETLMEFTGSKYWYIRDESGNSVGKLFKGEKFWVISKDGNDLEILTQSGVTGHIYCDPEGCPGYYKVYRVWYEVK